MEPRLVRWVGLVALGVAFACGAAATAQSYRRFPAGTGPAAQELAGPGWTPFQALARWDAGWYAEIARNGYWYRPGEQSPVAFFPAYPLAIRGAMSLGLNRFVAGVLLSLLFGVAAVVVFTLWAQTRASPAQARAAALVLLLYPFSFYLYGVMYSDGLFLLLAAGAFLCLERDRLGAAALLGALATATRPVAPAVVLGLVVRQLERRRSAGLPIRVRDFVPGLAGVGLALYMAFLWQRFGDPLAFAHVQGAPGWDQTPGWHTWLKEAWFHGLLTNRALSVQLRLMGHALAALLFLVLIIPTGKRLGWGYAVYVAVAVGLPSLSSKDFQGLGRYVIAAFPCFLTLALLLEPQRRLRLGWLAVSAGLLLLLAAAFGGTEYVA